MAKLLFAPLVILIIFSCNQKQRIAPVNPETPKPLQDKSASLSISKRSSGEDLVQALYNDSVSKNGELQLLENRIADYYANKEDSLSKYEYFKGKNEHYYAAARIYLNQIEDSVLNSRINSLLNASEAKYKSEMSASEAILSAIAGKESKQKDLQNVLMLITTLPVIESFQLSERPSMKPLQHLVIQLDSINRRTESLTK